MELSPWSQLKVTMTDHLMFLFQKNYYTVVSTSKTLDAEVVVKENVVTTL
jgi:hypothetical protein